MISAALNGGLGNQLFQIAAAYALSIANGTDCAFDFNVGIKNQGNNPMTYRDNIFRRLRQLPKEWRPTSVYSYNGMSYRAIPFKDGMLLKGYFQSENFFKNHTNIIRTVLSNGEIKNILMCKYSHLLKNSLSIHIRRGDYLTFNDTYHILGCEYYKAAIAEAEKRMRVQKIFVFSDDIKWCMDNLNDPRMLFVSGQKDYMDMYLMSLCTSNVIANSSFSWWGAWLGDDGRKTIIAPRNWFKNDTDINGLIPQRWTIV